MKKLALLVVLSSINGMHAYDEHDVEAKFLAREWQKAQQEQKEAIKEQQEALAIKSAVYRLKVALEKLDARAASKDEKQKTEAVKIESLKTENNVSIPVAIPVLLKVDVEKNLSKRERLEKFAQENPGKAKVALGLGIGSVVVGVYALIKHFAH